MLRLWLVAVNLFLLSAHIGCGSVLVVDSFPPLAQSPSCCHNTHVLRFVRHKKIPVLNYDGNKHE